MESNEYAVSADRHLSLAEAARTLAARLMDSLTVLDRYGNVEGYATKEDILSAIARGEDPEKVTLETVLKSAESNSDG
jgi:signal-transduction protein with cAMP-binding, CBS, and nucleotidyltransferase domain